MAAKPPALGTVNGYCPGWFVLHGRRYSYPGTTLHLTLAAIRAGARVGDELRDDFGFRYVMAAAGGGDRTPNGWWARRVR